MFVSTPPEPRSYDPRSGAPRPAERTSILRRTDDLPEEDRIRQRLDAVEIFVADEMRRAELRAAMKPLNDMERLINRITGGVAIPRDLIALQSSLEALLAILSLLPGSLPILGHMHECAEIRYHI